MPASISFAAGSIFSNGFLSFAGSITNIEPFTETSTKIPAKCAINYVALRKTDTKHVFVA